MLLFGTLLMFGLLTGRMVALGIPNTMDAHRDERPGKYWVLAAYNAFGASAGLYVIADTFNLLGV